ncbi:hypothetical protein DXG01_004038 [Tephrocybe rancida]|nr:hypothetical protein DXG01_004038 [Tephrocybe rancida]
MSAPPRILIVGAGPSGLICALTILKSGGQVRIVEKTTEPRLGQRGAGIMPRSLELFDRLGIADEILNQAVVLPPMRKYELQKTDALHEFELSPRTDPTPAFPYLNPVLLGQNKTEQTIHKALAKYSCEVDRGVELLSLRQFDDAVEVKLARRTLGANDGETIETAQYDWVIGADGARSAVRKGASFTFYGESRLEEQLVVGDIHMTGVSEKYWHLWGDAKNVMITLRPTETPNLFNFGIAGLNVDHTHLSSDENALKKFLLDHIASETEIKLGDIAWLSLFTPNIRMVESPQQGRVFLVGGERYNISQANLLTPCEDAGHVHSPTGGQGMNSGLQDAFNLGWKLALVQRNLAPPSLLQTYSEERIPVIREMLNQTTRILERTFTDQGDAWSRTGGLLQLGINCRWSSIVLDEHKEGDAIEGTTIDPYGDCSIGIRAGDRAPDATGVYDARSKLAQRLHSFFGPPHHTVLVFSPPHHCSTTLKQSLEEYPVGAVRTVMIIKPASSSLARPEGLDQDAELVLEDREGHAHVGYGISGDRCIVVVRPDGIIGAIVRGSEGLQKYFSKIFVRA